MPLPKSFLSSIWYKAVRGSAEVVVGKVELISNLFYRFKLKVHSYYTSSPSDSMAAGVAEGRDTSETEVY